MTVQLTPTAIAVPYADTRAEHLRLQLGRLREPAPALLKQTIVIARGQVVVEILGNSHRLTLTAELDGADDVELVETVACADTPDGDSTLPAAAGAQVHGMRHDFRSSVESLRSAAIDADELGRRGAIVGVFPGHPDALTAVLVDEIDGSVTDRIAAWTTWHAYPQSDELVRTWTTVTRSEVPA